MKTLFIVLFSLISFVGFSQNTEFQKVPRLNLKELKMYKDAINNYQISYPDSVSYVIFQKLGQIKQFIDTHALTDTVTLSISIPTKIVNQIEKQRYGGDILTWRPEKDNQFLFMKNQKEQIKRYEDELQLLKSIQCKYLDLFDILCPY